MKNVLSQQLKKYIEEYAPDKKKLELYKNLKISRQYIGQILNCKKAASLKIVDKIKDYDPNLSLNWLVYNIGPVYEESNVFNEPKENYKLCKKCKEKEVQITELRELNVMFREKLAVCKEKLNTYQNKKGAAG